MSQEDYAIADQAGTPFLADLNSHLAAIVSNNSGATEPSTTFAYQWWPDTTTGLLKIRNAANSGWVTVGTLASANLGHAALASPTFTGTVTIPTLALTNNLAIADGGTGQGTAAAAFAAIKQAATTTATGAVELATDAEAQAGTDSTRCVTPDNLGAVVLGMGQTWQNMTASRAVSTTYTNTTGRPIQVTVAMTSTSAGTARLTVSGVLLYGSFSTAGSPMMVSAIIPNGATYAATVDFGTGSLLSGGWLELR